MWQSMVAHQRKVVCLLSHWKLQAHLHVALKVCHSRGIGVLGCSLAPMRCHGKTELQALLLPVGPDSDQFACRKALTPSWTLQPGRTWW